MAVSQLVFVGTGVSTGIPVLGHILGQPSPNPDGCCCEQAIQETSKDRRNNVCALIRYRPQDAAAEQPPREILIDCGKTFRDAAIRVLRPLGVKRVDAILITHDHADAAGGLDDFRDLQTFEKDEASTSLVVKHKPPTFLTAKTLEVLRQQVSYIVEASQSREPLARRVTCLDFRTVGDDPGVVHPPFDAAGLLVQPVPLYHGGDYRALGFVFGERERVAYLSDMDRMSEVQAEVLVSRQVDVLVADCIQGPGRHHFSHTCFDQAWDLVTRFRPRRTYFVGMYCDLSHERGNRLCAERLAAHREADPSTRVESVELAYDGLVIDVRL
eukprot:TRINITY_DN32108_c0_g1_i2.p1 TRINITY_DN32108_c0_g1~~TRINITY_DN32108_c0_g1_i2.p1  ORF type:complete len:327 (+),score=50.10 TRINITY_DN32108_c0_g1_i2:70-1050(+)